MVGAVDKHLALIGFMGAGKSTLGRELARLTHRPFVDTDEEIEKRFGPIGELFERGEPEFRRIEEQIVAEALAGPTAVIALGGGAVLSEATRALLAARAFVARVTVDPNVAWERVRDSGRPLARDHQQFIDLWGERLDLYESVEDACGESAEELLLSALRIDVHTTPEAQRGKLGSPPPFAAAAIVIDERVLELHEYFWDGSTIHPIPRGEAAKALAVAQRLWSELEVGRDGWIVGIGGGAATDLAGFVAATYLRGVRWTAVPTTLVGMVDAAIGGKVGINTDDGKNLVGAFHFPQYVWIDTALLKTLPVDERRAGMAEVVKTGLLAGADIWELQEEEMIRACAA